MPKQYYWLLRHIRLGKVIRAGRYAKDIAEFMGISPSLVTQRSALKTLHQGNGFDGCRIDKIDPELTAADAWQLLCRYESPCERCKVKHLCNRPCKPFRFWVKLKLQSARTVFRRRPG